MTMLNINLFNFSYITFAYKVSCDFFMNKVYLNKIKHERNSSIAFIICYIFDINNNAHVE